ncbi:MAG: class I SAM-dependent methyltransferase [Saprospiraceae bacterium]
MKTIIENISIENFQFSILQYEEPLSFLDLLLAKGDDHPDVLDERIPYWLELWPSAIGLGRHLFSLGTIISGQTTLELGCGIGIPSMVVEKLEGRPILSDYTQEALDFSKSNWQLNVNQLPPFIELDWRNPPSDLKVDFILASDIAYERRYFSVLPITFKKLIKPGGKIFLSEPGRIIAVEFMDLLEKEGFEIAVFSYEGTLKGKQYCVQVYELYPPDIN